MAEPILDVGQFLNLSEFTKAFWGTIPQEFLGSVTFLFTLAKAISIVFLVYLVFLIIKSIVSIRQALRTKLIAETVVEINKKLDLIVGKHHKKEHDKKP